MKEYLEKLLLESSYQKILSNLSEITLYASYMESRVQVVQVMDFREKTLVTKEQYEMIRNSAENFFKNRGFLTVHMLTIILTPSQNVMEAKKFVLDDKFCWIVDTSLNTLVVSRNQNKDFYGLKNLVYQACALASDSAPIPEPLPSYTPGRADKQKKARKKSFLANNYAPLNMIIIGINVAAFIYLSIIGSTLDLEFMLKYGVLYVPYIMEYHEFYRFLTCMFLHFGFQHLAGNMVVLFFLGDNVERAVGKVKYLIIYIGSGLLGSFGSFVFAYLFNQNIVSAGASGAIFGMIGALLWIVICNRGRLEDMTTFRLSLLIFYALYSGVTGENIDNAAHIAGLVGGFLLAVILYERKRVNEN